MTENEKLLLDTLKSAVDSLEEWGAHVGDYFKDKYYYERDLAYYRRIIAKFERVSDKEQL